MSMADAYPKVSIITPSYNQASFIEETIRSVFALDYPNVEYMIVDAQSTDGSVEIIRKYANRLAWWVSEKDRGQSDGINKGFAHATGDILAWINSDDTYFPGAVSEAVAFLKAHPQAGMVYADANIIDHSGSLVGKFPAKQTDYRRMLRGSVHIPQATTFFRADLYRQVGPLDPVMYYAFDYDLWLRLAKISELCYLPRLWANFRIHDAAKTIKNDDVCYADMQRIVERETGHKFTWLSLRRVIRRIGYAWLPVHLRMRIRKALTF